VWRLLWTFDGEMSDLPGDRVNDYAAYLTAGSIGATGVGADPERHHLRHPFCFPWTLASPASSGTSNSRTEDRRAWPSIH
jgi:hypothetical protein